jgi:hypothetical protein
MASALNDMGFSKESVRRNPAIDLGGASFFIIDSFVSPTETFFSLSGRGAALMTALCASSGSKLQFFSGPTL